MDNRDGKFVEKLVFFYLSGYVSESWEMSEGEMEKYDAQAQNITTSLATVDSQVKSYVQCSSMMIRGFVLLSRHFLNRVLSDRRNWNEIPLFQFETIWCLLTNDSAAHKWKLHVWCWTWPTTTNNRDNIDINEGINSDSRAIDNDNEINGDGNSNDVGIGNSNDNDIGNSNNDDDIGNNSDDDDTALENSSNDDGTFNINDIYCK